MKRTISIDHGNRLIKTPSHVFPASYVAADNLPQISTDVLFYQGKEYTLADKRMPQLNDKTVDDRYFLLTLFAIGKEIAKEADMFMRLTPKDAIGVELLVGLPPLHCKSMGKKFKAYFKNREERIFFELNKKPFAVKITNVHVYPQAFAAVISNLQKINDTQIVNIIDIGGYTVDILQLVEGQPNMDICTSLYGGVNTLFDKINEQTRAEGKANIPDFAIENILRNNTIALQENSPKRIELVKSCSEIYAKRLISELGSTGVDLDENKTVFIGGGSLLLQEQIIKAGRISRLEFVNDIKANAKGYLEMYQAQRLPQPTGTKNARVG